MSQDFTTSQPSPAERAARAERRVKELRQRSAELAAGERPSQDSVDVARDRAEESMHRAEDAHHAAVEGHERLARVHERMANTYQRAALDGYGSPAGLQQAADQHWQAAHDSRLEALEDVKNGDTFPTEAS